MYVSTSVYVLVQSSSLLAYPYFFLLLFFSFYFGGPNLFWQLVYNYN